MSRPAPAGETTKIIYNVICFLAFTAVYQFLLLNVSAAGSGDASPIISSRADKSVLVLYSYGHATPAYQKINPAFLAAVNEAKINPSKVYVEFLDLLHLPDELQKLSLAEALRRKYQQIDIDLLVVLDAPAMRFLQDEPLHLFSKIPVVSWSSDESFSGNLSHRWVIPLSASLDIKGTLQQALELFPKTQRVVFVVGVSKDDQYAENEARKAFSMWRNQLTCEYTTSLSVGEMLEYVAHLPEHSIVIYGSVFKDRTGQTYIPVEVGRQVAEKANAPVFALYDTMLETGVIGGSVLNFAAEGTRIGHVAARVLDGRISPSTQLSPMKNQPHAMFDWRQVRRWGAKVDNLPEQTIFLHRPSSLWKQFRLQLIGILVFMIFQLIFIWGLLFAQRRKRGQLRHEINRRASIEAKLREKMVEYEAMFERSVVGKAQADQATGRFLKVNKAFADMLGYLPVELLQLTPLDITHPEDQEQEERDYAAIRTGKVDQWHTEKRYLRKDGKVVWVNISGNVMHIDDENPPRTIAVIQDVTERKLTEEALKNSLAEKEVLLREIHHRVKNNMQVISSLVDLQANEVDDERMAGVFREVIHRVRSMAIVHEKLYQSTDFAKVDFADYTDSLLTYLWQAQGAISPGLILKKNLQTVLLPVNEAVPCGLILNELFTNALKHAFVGRESGEITVSLQRDRDKKIVLSVQDNGIGMPGEMDIPYAQSLGIRLIQMLSGQLNATVDTKVDNGTTFTIMFEGLEP